MTAEQAPGHEPGPTQCRPHIVYGALEEIIRIPQGHREDERIASHLSRACEAAAADEACKLLGVRQAVDLEQIGLEQLIQKPDDLVLRWRMILELDHQTRPDLIN